MLKALDYRIQVATPMYQDLENSLNVHMKKRKLNSNYKIISYLQETTPKIFRVHYNPIL